jgi:hypothetical protein
MLQYSILYTLDLYTRYSIRSRAGGCELRNGRLDKEPCVFQLSIVGDTKLNRPFGTYVRLGLDAG